MKRRITVVMLAMFLLSGCSGWYQDSSHAISKMTGLNRRIVLYSDNGSTIKTWEGKYVVEIDGSSARFMHSRKAVTISGTFIIEEI